MTQRHQINDKRAFENIVKFVASNIGNPLSPSNIAKTLKQDGQSVHNTNVERYLDYLVACFVFYKVNRFDPKGKKQLATQEKYYLVDAGLLNILAGKERTTDRGHILENVVYLELLRRGNKIWTGTSRNSEVDFVCRTKTGDIEYYQVARLMTNENTVKRVFAALVLCPQKNFNEMSFFFQISSLKILVIVITMPAFFALVLKKITSIII
ncbi:MAG: DUF4143 domain-containing protein [Chitinophagales bacterium]|nr:DUF4143 domain-containing protein [Chitinophagales bacterium]